MFAKLKELREEREGGFTLIELLVVILIIGILAAIAIPMFLNQRKSAVDSSVQSDVKNAATQIEASFIKAQGAKVLQPELATTLAASKHGAGTKLEVSGTSDKYCILGLNTGGDVANTSTTKGITYKSDAGGLQSAAGDCTGY